MKLDQIRVHRILADLLDQSCKEKDLMISLTNVSEDTFTQIASFMNMLKSCGLSYDLYVGLASHELDQVNSLINRQTMNLFNLCSNHILITLSDGSRTRFLHTEIALAKNKSYRYLLAVDGLHSCPSLKRAVSIMDSRGDLVADRLGGSTHADFARRTTSPLADR